MAKTGFSYQTKTELELDKIKQTAENEDIDKKINSEIQEIQKQIDVHKKQEIDEKKPEIVSLLTDEIIKRYTYKEGLYEYYTRHNPEILEAQKILNSPSRYSEILK